MTGPTLDWDRRIWSTAWSLARSLLFVMIKAFNSSSDDFSVTIMP
jgi:hypothetical protein